MSDVARVLRILAKHATACADEIEGAATTEPVEEPSPAEVLEQARREAAERRKSLGGNA